MIPPGLHGRFPVTLSDIPRWTHVANHGVLFPLINIYSCFQPGRHGKGISPAWEGRNIQVREPYLIKVWLIANESIESHKKSCPSNIIRICISFGFSFHAISWLHSGGRHGSTLQSKLSIHRELCGLSWPSTLQFCFTPLKTGNVFTVLKPMKQWKQLGNMQNWKFLAFLNKNPPSWPSSLPFFHL